jgi:metallo-beta-lactamase family protein
MTEATRAITQLTLLDTVHIAREHRHGMLLFDEQDVSWVLSRAVVVPYNQVVETSKFSVIFRDAGHILGSAFLDVYCKDTKDTIRRIIFSGDIGNYPEELVRPTATVDQADIVLIESTYGDREHTQENPADVIGEEIAAIEQSHGVLLIPAFSVERSQEILHLIDHLKKNGKVQEKTPVFLDSTLAIHVTKIYQHYRNLYNSELTEHARVDDPFDFPGLTMVEKPYQSRELVTLPGPKVIIAGSGMMNGGRILRHAKENLPSGNTRLLFVGFQAEGTLGREILEGAKQVFIDGTSVPVRCLVRKSSGMSSHADQPKLLAWLNHIQEVSTVCLVHGEDKPRHALAEKIQSLPHPPNIMIPMKGETKVFGEDSHSYSAYGSSVPSPKKSRVVE